MRKYTLTHTQTSHSHCLSPLTVIATTLADLFPVVYHFRLLFTHS